MSDAGTGADGPTGLRYGQAAARWVLLATVLGSAMAMLDGTVVNLALPRIAEDLDALNEAYERVFGFRFVIFVAGRPRSAIVPMLEASLRDERISELRRGVDDVVYVAADRLRTLRG